LSTGSQPSLFVGTSFSSDPISVASLVTPEASQNTLQFLSPVFKEVSKDNNDPSVQEQSRHQDQDQYPLLQPTTKTSSVDSPRKLIHSVGRLQRPPTHYTHEEPPINPAPFTSLSVTFKFLQQQKDAKKAKKDFHYAQHWTKI
jgi:hypothetical protein